MMMSGGTMSGPHREQLAELDEGRAELVEQLAQVHAAGGRPTLARRREPRLRRAPGQQVGELVRLEEVAEAVSHHHLCDLRETAEIARRRLGHQCS